jgi:uncharacterized protein YdaU (DUF1376 family)
VNFYPRHLGDYARDTGHLTMLEHGAYTLLLDRCYATEQGIPADQAHRLARARTDEENAAVDAVLAEFFSLRDGVWMHGRVEREIAAAQARIAAAQENGKKGGRPPKNPEQTDEKPGGLPVGSKSEPSEKLTKSQKPKANPNQLSSKASLGTAPASRAAKKCPDSFAVDDALRAWAAEKTPSVNLELETEKFRDHTFTKALTDWDGAWRNWMRNAEEWQGKSAPRSPPRRSTHDISGMNYRAGIGESGELL